MLLSDKLSSIRDVRSLNPCITMTTQNSYKRPANTLKVRPLQAIIMESAGYIH